MRRTQIHLTDEQGRMLHDRSKTSGATLSELIRAAIDSTYGRRRAMTRAAKTRVARRTAGAWKDVSETGAEYVERVRGARRLARLHGSECCAWSSTPAC